MASHERTNGIFYTPPELADLVANLAIPSADSTVLDPCYGEGALLLAAHKRLLALCSTTPDKQLFGYDIAPLPENVRRNCSLEVLSEENLKERDLFSSFDQPEMRFDVVLMNPPFVRYNLIPIETRKRIRSIVGNEGKLPTKSDFWVYFLIHSLKFIRNNGNLAAILPWSFLYADFAKGVRELLLEKFRILRIIAIGQRMFEKADVRILVLVGIGYGGSSSEIGVCYSSGISKRKISWKPIEQNIWRSSPWICLVNSNIHKIISKVGNGIGFETLGCFAKIRIGTVTGANNFFILDRETAKSMILPEIILRPIITGSRNLQKLVVSDSEDIRDMMLMIPEGMELPESLKEYIKIGEENGLNKRCHTKKRIKWYSIPHQKPPSGFIHYMTKEIPFIVLNPDGLLSTNTVHHVDFYDGVDENTQKWIQFSMLTSVSQLSVEMVGRTYGSGILKIEPTAISKILVYPGNGHCFPVDMETKLNNLLLQNKRREAMEFADKWVLENLGISRKNMNSIKKCYENIRDCRLGNKI